MKKFSFSFIVNNLINFLGLIVLLGISSLMTMTTLSQISKDFYSKQSFFNIDSSLLFYFISVVITILPLHLFATGLQKEKKYSKLWAFVSVCITIASLNTVSSVNTNISKEQLNEKKDKEYKNSIKFNEYSMHIEEWKNTNKILQDSLLVCNSNLSDLVITKNNLPDNRTTDKVNLSKSYDNLQNKCNEISVFLLKHNDKKPSLDISVNPNNTLYSYDDEDIYNNFTNFLNVYLPIKASVYFVKNTMILILAVLLEIFSFIFYSKIFKQSEFENVEYLNKKDYDNDMLKLSNLITKIIEKISHLLNRNTYKAFDDFTKSSNIFTENSEILEVKINEYFENSMKIIKKFLIENCDDKLKDCIDNFLKGINQDGTLVCYEDMERDYGLGKYHNTSLRKMLDDKYNLIIRKGNRAIIDFSKITME